MAVCITGWVQRNSLYISNETWTSVRWKIAKLCIQYFNVNGKLFCEFFISRVHIFSHSFPVPIICWNFFLLNFDILNMDAVMMFNWNLFIYSWCLWELQFPWVAKLCYVVPRKTAKVSCAQLLKNIIFQNKTNAFKSECMSKHYISNSYNSTSAYLSELFSHFLFEECSDFKANSITVNSTIRN